MEIYKWFKRVLLVGCSILLFALFLIVFGYTCYTGAVHNAKEMVLLIIILLLSFMLFVFSHVLHRNGNSNIICYVVTGTIIFILATVQLVVSIVDYSNPDALEKTEIWLPILIEVLSIFAFAGYIGAAVMTKYIEKHDN